MNTELTDIVLDPAVFDDLCLHLDLKTDVAKLALGYALENIKVLDQKQQDYGSGNIALFGEQGVMVRVGDKLMRLRNLLQSTDAPKHESIQDSWLDLANYGLIGALCHARLWPGLEQQRMD